MPLQGQLVQSSGLVEGSQKMLILSLVLCPVLVWRCSCYRTFRSQSKIHWTMFWMNSWMALQSLSLKIKPRGPQRFAEVRTGSDAKWCLKELHVHKNPAHGNAFPFLRRICVLCCLARAQISCQILLAVLLPHPSDTLFVQSHHFSCPVWRVNSLRQGLCIRCSSTLSPNAVDGSSRGSAVISLQGHKGLFSCVSLSWFGVGRVRWGTLPGLVKCSRTKSIAQKAQPRFLAPPNTAPPRPRRKQSREIGGKNPQSL